jgi:hypothetical protein
MGNPSLGCLFFSFKNSIPTNQEQRVVMAAASGAQEP